MSVLKAAASRNTFLPAVNHCPLESLGPDVICRLMQTVSCALLFANASETTGSMLLLKSKFALALRGDNPRTSFRFELRLPRRNASIQLIHQSREVEGPSSADAHTVSAVVSTTLATTWDSARFVVRQKSRLSPDRAICDAGLRAVPG